MFVAVLREGIIKGFFFDRKLLIESLFEEIYGITSSNGRLSIIHYYEPLYIENSACSQRYELWAKCIIKFQEYLPTTDIKVDPEAVNPSGFLTTHVYSP